MDKNEKAWVVALLRGYADGIENGTIDVEVPELAKPDQLAFIAVDPKEAIDLGLSAYADAGASLVLRLSEQELLRRRLFAETKAALEHEQDKQIVEEMEQRVAAMRLPHCEACDE